MTDNYITVLADLVRHLLRRVVDMRANRFVIMTRVLETGWLRQIANEGDVLSVE